ncbi:T9SS type A sorting domain-containing protein [Adhaeribacter terreus]|uniref:T9SS type A sorting domain-containing protein n=1 Tax=Adhaeribacter terreus TaxID=529703 RepID=A0ABW0EE44_9BACT
MKKLLLTLGAFMALSAAQAQYYYVPHKGSNPGTLNADPEYPVNGGLPADWTTLVTGSASTLTTPVWSSNVTLPFSFSLNGTSFTTYKVSTSGVLTFDIAATAVPSVNNVALPSANIPDNSIMVWGLYANAGDFIVTKTFGTAPNRQHWIQFNSYSQTTNPAVGYTYWSIVLEETTNKVYIVDQRSAGASMGVTAGMQLNSTTAFQVNGSPNLNSRTLASSDPASTDNTYYEFLAGTQITYDLETLVLNTPPKLAISRAPFTISGNLWSRGSAPVTSFDLNYKVGNNPTVTSNITGVNIGSYGGYNFTHPTAWNPGAIGTYPIKVWASNINGNADQNHANDTIQLSVSVEQSPRTTVNEVFTSSTCPPCLPGNANISNVTHKHPGTTIQIKYQQNFPPPGDDPYQTNESIARRNYYAVNSIPQMRPDGGVKFKTPLEWGSTQSAFNANGYSEALLNKYYNVPASILVDGEFYIDPVDSTVTARALITPFANVTSNNLVLHTVITERHTVRNFRTNGETDFYDVAKKMLPDENGLPIAALVNGQQVKYTNAFAMNYNDYTLPFTKFAVTPNFVENMDSLQVVFFVQDKNTKEVFNAGMGKRVSQPLGVSKNLEAVAQVNVYPNPTTGKVNIAFTPEKAGKATLEIYNAVGARVWNTTISAAEVNGKRIDADLSNQPNGFYFLNLKYGDKVLTKKIVLIK